MAEYTVTFDESQRQLVLMALGHLEVEHPKWEAGALQAIAEKLDGLTLFNQFFGEQRKAIDLLFATGNAAMEETAALYQRLDQMSDNKPTPEASNN